jgi:hypothetical protein
MTTNKNTKSLSTDSEQVVREYFEAHTGWTVTKLDTGREKAADFRVYDTQICFLCEVKTIESVRANFPYAPLDYYRQQRVKNRSEIEKWKKENPELKLIMPPGEWDFIYGDENEFTKKYRRLGRNTEKWFTKFSKDVEDYLMHSSIRDFPYRLRIDSDNMYVPNESERKIFLKWLENEISAITRGEISGHWQPQNLLNGRVIGYSSFYQIHMPTHENDTPVYYQLTIEGPLASGPLKISSFAYGGLNLDAIISNVESGLKQLESSAMRETDPQIPRIIALAFTSGLGFEKEQLSPCITKLLQNHPNLSAIAVLEWIPDGTPPPEEKGFLAWAQFQATTPRIPRFIVYHNPWLQSVKPLPASIFNDKWSIQITPTR